MAAVSSSPGVRSRRYRRRRPLRALILLMILGAVTAVVWTRVLGQVSPEAAACPQPARTAPPYSGEVLAPTALEGVAPAPPQLAPIRVLNGGGMRGQATIVTARLVELGFERVAEPANDPLHPDFELNCHGQIRFGAQGKAAARTLGLVVPCAELVRDVRNDNTVDLALGSEFKALRPTDEARAVLQNLAQLGQPVPQSDGPQSDGQRGGQVGEQVEPAIDPELLEAARDVRC